MTLRSRIDAFRNRNLSTWRASVDRKLEAILATLQDLQDLITSESSLIQAFSDELTQFAASQQQFDADLQTLIAWAKANSADPALIDNLVNSQTANNQAFSAFATKLASAAQTLATEDTEVNTTDGNNQQQQSQSSSTTAVNQPPAAKSPNLTGPAAGSASGTQTSATSDAGAAGASPASNGDPAASTAGANADSVQGPIHGAKG